MNMPADPVLRDASLSDKYRAERGRVYLTGTQALVRLALMQRRRDVAAGLNTAGYVTGYRGSPLGGYDQALWKAARELAEHHVKFEPGTNEDLAATALWGSQQLNLFEGARYDGVFGIWYGKGPGVDRSGDVFRHANQSGSARHGGVLALAGDDHGAKSSTVAAQTDFIFKAVGMPVLAPAAVQDYLDLGLHGFALSRFSGLWVGFKCVTDSVESAAIVDVSPDRVGVVLPEIELPPGGLNARWPEEPFQRIEERLMRWKLPAARAYARANRLDRVVLGDASSMRARLGIVTTGKAHLDAMQALVDLGIDDETARRLGIRVFKVAMPWPLEPEAAAEFALACDEVLVVEEKRSLVEAQLRELLFGVPGVPRLVGKVDEQRAPLLPESGELSPALLARVIAARIARFGRVESVEARLAALDAKERASARRFEVIDRIPYFCSGCPHSTSTRVPEGSRALAGIGCHFMAQWMDRNTATFTHMGGEGAAWIGQAPFSDTKHVFQNLGDGTYFHSGSLAIRHAVATRTRITYKILFNDAVAMTGGQPHDGQLTPQRIARQVKAEGVGKVVVVSDDVGKYPAGSFDADVALHERSRLDEVQRELREFDGVSVLIYDQTCAAEKRRRRKRSQMPDPPRRIMINEAVCEGCGDCGVKSNCVSVEPIETEFGRKRTINQSSCNKDYSCVNGFCPSFVSIEGGALRRPRPASVADAPAAGLPAPRLPEIDGARSFALLVTGIGGTGVVTIGQILGMAAHLESRAVTVLDMAGLAQKGGAVMSFIRFGGSDASLHAPRIGVAGADAVIGCDLVVTAGADTLSRIEAGRTRAVVNVTMTPTGDFTRNPDWKFPAGGMHDAIADAVGAEHVGFVDASRLATALMGDAIATNLFMLGYAYQRGLVPISAPAIERAIELNEVAVEMNKRAFAWGRLAAVDPQRVEHAVAPGPAPVDRRLSGSIEELIARRVDFLTDYQDEAWARRYLASVERVRAAERNGGSRELTETVARNLFKLMSYKDEYEVARLYTNGDFLERVGRSFDGDWKLRFHLAPPLLAKRDANGHLVKRSYGPWMLKAFGVLARMRRLRGTRLDPFGRTEERRIERRLIADYEATLTRLLSALDAADGTPAAAEKLDIAIGIAALPEQIRGFGHVKLRNLAAARERERELLARLDRTTIQLTPA